MTINLNSTPNKTWDLEELQATLRAQVPSLEEARRLQEETDLWITEKYWNEWRYDGLETAPEWAEDIQSMFEEHVAYLKSLNV